MYLKEELCRKINDLYPDIGQCGFDITVEYDTEQKVWLVDLEKGNHELKHHLEIQDEGRVKHLEECIKKFHRKYHSQLEAAEHPYEIKYFISDLIGIRIVCLYEDQIPHISALLQKYFRILDVSDKIATIESTEYPAETEPIQKMLLVRQAVIELKRKVYTNFL